MSDLFPKNVCPSVDRLPAGLLEFLRPLHEAFTPWRNRLAELRVRQKSGVETRPIDHHRDHWIHKEAWECDVPDWARQQRNQMTGPADDAAMVVKMTNSGTDSVMYDLEDSMVNGFEHTLRGVANVKAALEGTLEYDDPKRGRVQINRGNCVMYTRVRGLHMAQHGIFDEPMSASVFDAAMLVWSLDPSKLSHPICFYIPKTESGIEGVFWDELFTALEQAMDLPIGHIRCMALVESHPMAYQMEEFLYHMRRRILGLNFGRWDYIASTLDYNLHDAAWVLCDRNALPITAPFVQNVRRLIPRICHKRKALAIGGMTALFPSRTDAELNARALAALEKDKQNEAACGFDGAWTGHPDQNDVATAQFPTPNQMGALCDDVERYPDLRPSPAGLGPITEAGTRAAIRTCIRYRAGVLAGKGAVLIDGYMEDLATDRIYRNMIEQRVRHGHHAWAQVTDMFADELAALLASKEYGPGSNSPYAAHLAEAAIRTMQMIETGTRNPD